MSNAALCTIRLARVSAICDIHAGERHKPETCRHNKSDAINSSSTCTLAKHVGLTSPFALYTWGCPFACAARSRAMPGLTTMPHHPRWVSSSKLPCWPQGDQRCDLAPPSAVLSRVRLRNSHCMLHHKPRRINTTRQPTRSTHHCSGSVRKPTVTTEVPHDGFHK